MKYQKAIRFFLLVGLVLLATVIPFLIVGWINEEINQEELVMFFMCLAFTVGILCLYFLTEDYSFRVIKLILAILYGFTSIIFATNSGKIGFLSFAAAILYIVAVSLRMAEYEPEAPISKETDLLDQFDY